MKNRHSSLIGHATVPCLAEDYHNEDDGNDGDDDDPHGEDHTRHDGGLRYLVSGKVAALELVLGLGLVVVDVVLGVVVLVRDLDPLERRRRRLRRGGGRRRRVEVDQVLQRVFC